MGLGIVPRLGWSGRGRGHPRPRICSFGIRAAGREYGFVVEISQAKFSRSSLSVQEIAGRARDYAVEVMRSRGNEPEQIQATEPRQIRWDPDSVLFRYCQYFGFGPDGGSVLFLNRPPAGEADLLAASAFAAETPVDDAD